MDETVDKILLYFSKKDLTKRFQDIFQKEVKNDTEFQQKMKEVTNPDSDDFYRGDENLMLKIVTANDYLSKGARDNLFKQWEVTLKTIMETKSSS